MAGLKERLSAEMKQALKAGEKVRLGALRLLLASVKNREVELRRALSDEQFVEVVAHEVKRRKEAIEAYEKGGRPELAAREREEQAVLERYLPVALAEAEVEALIVEAVAATGAAGPGDLGRVMAHVMERAKGRVDGAKVNAMVRARLAASEGG